MPGEIIRKAQFSQTQVRAVLEAFYAKVLRDPELGPVFAAAIDAGQWESHFEKVLQFWLTALRIRPGYRGRDFMPAHLKHAHIRAEHAEPWLRLFEETVRDMCDRPQADALLAIARAMMENIRIGLARRDGQGAGEFAPGVSGCDAQERSLRSQAGPIKNPAA